MRKNKQDTGKKKSYRTTTKSVAHSEMIKWNMWMVNDEVKKMV